MSRVHFVDGAAKGGYPSGEKGFSQALGRHRQIGEHAEATEALAEHAPAVDAERNANVLGIGHDGVSAEVRQVLGLLRG